jgi:predicted naringenin-chalcone synthase
MVCVELCTLHFQYGWNTEQLVPNALFADGAAAAMLGPEDADTTGPGWRVLETRSRLFDGTDDVMTWHIGDHGFEMTLSPTVPDVVAESAGPWVEHWLDQHGLGFDDVAAWAIHPGGPRIVSGLAKRLGLDDEAIAASQSVLRHCGNMSSATVLFVLERLWRDGAGSPCVAMSFGPGLIAEGALLG